MSLVPCDNEQCGRRCVNTWGPAVMIITIDGPFKRQRLVFCSHKCMVAHVLAAVGELGGDSCPAVECPDNDGRGRCVAEGAAGTPTPCQDEELEGSA